jgi:hypothetical protein
MNYLKWLGRYSSLLGVAVITIYFISKIRTGNSFITTKFLNITIIVCISVSIVSNIVYWSKFKTRR